MSESIYTDSQWLKSIGFVEDSNKDYVLAGWLVITCEAGKWNAYSVRSSHWHFLCGVEFREHVEILVSALKLSDNANAKLIAAAPMMLKALQRIVRHQDYIGGSMAKMSSTRHIAAQAVRHATGEVM